MQLWRQHVVLQDVWALLRACCSAAAHLHASGIAHRDLRRYNVLTRANKEGDYVVVDLEMAGPLDEPWLGPDGNPLSFLADWNDNTLNKVASHPAHLPCCVHVHALRSQ